ncbi:hypothetical protein LEMLEM_LOCUS14169 [Lemmus lemmus]
MPLFLNQNPGNSESIGAYRKGKEPLLIWSSWRGICRYFTYGLITSTMAM